MSTSKEEGSSSESEISISKRFWTNCRNEVPYFRYSPLFVPMASGSLDAKEFNQHVANYAHFLKDFMEVYKLVADHCEDNSDKAAFLGWSSNVKQELEMHNSFAEQKLGLNPTVETALHPATAKYIEYLLATASGNVEVSETPMRQSKITAYTRSVMTPSLRVYAFLKKVNKLDASVNIMSCWSEELTRSALSDGIFTGEVTRQAHQNETFILTLSELQLTTNSFCKANLLGEGSAGSLCKAQFTDGQIFAARVADTVALSLHEEHIIQNVARLGHPNIKTFTGQHQLPWLGRLNIALGIAWALDYMRSTSFPPANNSMQTANVLLDDEFMPLLCDSGLAVLRPSTGNNTHFKASDSTKGYILSFATAPKGSSIPPFNTGECFPEFLPRNGLHTYVCREQILMLLYPAAHNH